VTPTVGQKFTYDRVFTVEDVELFTRVTGDAGRHHVTPDADGRVMVQGLLTATLPTKFGGDINYLAREMRFEFVRPVFTGDTIVTEVVCVEAVDEDRVVRLSFEVVCKNQHGKEVLKGSTNGVIRK
jgi:3-hydroxybutyryl-CoA dehydratase